MSYQAAVPVPDRARDASYVDLDPVVQKPVPAQGMVYLVITGNDPRPEQGAPVHWGDRSQFVEQLVRIVKLDTAKRLVLR
jgi:hypothetical protein